MSTRTSAMGFSTVALTSIPPHLSGALNPCATSTTISNATPVARVWELSTRSPWSTHAGATSQASSEFMYSQVDERLVGHLSQVVKKSYDSVCELGVCMRVHSDRTAISKICWRNFKKSIFKKSKSSLAGRFRSPSPPRAKRQALTP